MLQNRINELEQQLKNLKTGQRNCGHVFGEPYDSKEEYLTGQYETHGIHHWPITAWKDVRKNRWTRRCTKCGFDEHTEILKTVKVEQAPDFK
jgi:hypothetical protein